jgi:hypothetical protein
VLFYERHLILNVHEKKNFPDYVVQSQDLDSKCWAEAFSLIQSKSSEPGAEKKGVWMRQVLKCSGECRKWGRGFRSEGPFSEVGIESQELKASV